MTLKINLWIIKDPSIRNKCGQIQYYQEKDEKTWAQVDFYAELSPKRFDTYSYSMLWRYTKKDLKQQQKKTEVEMNPWTVH